MADKQHTIEKAVSISGKGIHTGKLVTLTFKPAPENVGFVFRRIDLEGQPEIPADVDLVVDTSRGTTLELNGVRIHTIEHSLAALVGAGIDNIYLEMDGPELPIMDGSSVKFSEALFTAGKKEQQADRNYFHLPVSMFFTDKVKNAEMAIYPNEDYELAVEIDYNEPVLGQQVATSHIKDFAKEISGSRTFCFLHEVQFLLQHNLIKGGDLDNAIVIVGKKPDENVLNDLAKVFNLDKVEVKEEGILNNIELRHKNEPARHKLLDVIGDLALIGRPIKGKVVAVRPGHSTNIEFAKKIKSLMKDQNKMKLPPIYDPNKPPVYDIIKIEASLPHKYPFLLIDKIIELNENSVVGIKNVTMNENFFQGHFPQNPVMPGVLQLEAMAQTGGILVLNTVTDPQNWDTYFLKIDNAKFKQKVVPGDTLIMRLELLSPIRRGICEMHGTAFVGNKVVTEADLVAQIVKKANV